jgi:hypothetical protein
MRLVSFHTGSGPAAAVQVGDDLDPVSALDLPATSVRGILEALDADGLRELHGRAERASERIALADATLLALSPTRRRSSVSASTTVTTPKRQARRSRPPPCGLRSLRTLSSAAGKR